MSEIMKCIECKTTKSRQFRSLAGNKWEEAEANGLIKTTWVKGNKLCNSCYMNFVENQLRKAKRVKVLVEVVEASEVVAEPVANVAVGGVEVIDIEDIIRKEIEAKIKEGIELGDMETIMEEEVKAINDEEARPFKRCEKTIGRMKKLMVFLCYLLALLNNSKINSFKFDLAYYLDSVGTSNECLNTLANLGITTTARAVDRRKKQISEAHEEYIEKVLKNRSENAFILNIDDYHNIHINRQPDTTSTSWAAHMATIIANPCPTSAIPQNRALNPKVADDELIMKHLDKRFIVNLGISYYDRRQKYIGKCSDDKLMKRLTLHSYDDRLEEKKKSNRHIQNAILFDFVEIRLKSVEDYTKALQIVYNQKPMQEYLSNNVVPIVADWPGQFFIRKAIAHRLLLNNEIIPSCVAAFIPMMGPLHVSLNSRELVFKKNWFLFNEVYKGIFEQKKELGKKPQPWRIDLMLHIMHMAWLNISNLVYSKFGRTCKNIEFLYLTNLLSNLIHLVLEVYERAPLMFFSDVFYWMKENHPMFEMVTNNLSSLSNCPVELVHSIIRQRTTKFSEANQLQKEARFIFQHRGDNAFRQYFVNSIKYPYSQKQLHTLYQKCATILLNTFKKIYRGRYLYSSIISSSDNINTYNLPSLGYEITDHNGKVLACGHGYNDYCLEKCNLKCLICLDYLRGEVSKNINALRVSMRKKLGENEFIEEDFGGVVEDDLDNSETAIDDAATIENLENAKKSFFEL
ncbi:hypothetical protein C2G38_2239741 [Gigaspora rosea]|uniref:Uncharacterized protein n=1 Tax=Gigaspora rosea TaxID=44941 RepID=A0A397W1F9_9GLOM|nr:hypothetical protein C2G38_2239741 [Gigaspora rosea]